MGRDKISYGGHKWQLSDGGIVILSQKLGFKRVIFQISPPMTKGDTDLKKKKLKKFLKNYLSK